MSWRSVAQIGAGVREGIFWLEAVRQRCQGKAFDSSKFLDQKNHMYSISLSLLDCFELLAKLHVVVKGVNLRKEAQRTKGMK